jgi:hypothetical protein
MRVVFELVIGNVAEFVSTFGSVEGVFREILPITNKIKNPFGVSIHTAGLIVDTLPRNIAAPDGSVVPTNSCPIFVRIMNDEIIFSSRVPLILSVNF